MNAAWESRRRRTAAWKADQHRAITPEVLAEKARWVRERTYSQDGAVAFARQMAVWGSTAKDVELWTAVAEYLTQERAK